MSADQIRAAVAAVRPKLPLLAADYADRAIASGKTLAQVKGDLVDLMSTDTRALSKANMIAQARSKGLLPADPAPEAIAATAAAGGLGSRSTSIDNMRATVRQAGMTPTR